ncbi:MAG: helix-turn-helix domain-containing protein [Prolixibacteraceae bacterium]|nr:helix-turn-helix domain-containing protein [Prolixibacteraceae bacterium]
MKYTTLHIKNMVCNRCIKVIKDEFEKLNLKIGTIELGKVELTSPPNESMLSKIKNVLNENGFELIDDKKSKIIDHIKTLVIEITHYEKRVPESINISEFISKEIGYDYSYLSNLFSSVEGITIEKYTINQKIEKVKELLVYDELSLKEISFKLGYSSVQHLSNQFKKITGMTPSYFKKLKGTRRKPLDEV